MASSYKRRELEDILLNHDEVFGKGMGSDNDKFPSSGWKLHVYGENVPDSASIVLATARFLREREIPFKVATRNFYQLCPPPHKQHGKAATIYLPMRYIHNRGIFDLISEIVGLLKDSGYSKSGKISGDKHHEGSIHYRYGMKIPMLYEGFNAKLSQDNYRANDGNYNIYSNTDLFDLFTRR